MLITLKACRSPRCFLFPNHKPSNPECCEVIKKSLKENKDICFVTEVDHDRETAGAITSDLKTINCLKKFGDVDYIFLKRKKYRSLWSALLAFIFEILKSFSKPYSVYFSRGLVISLILFFFKPVHRRKIVHQSFSVPLASSEVKYLGYNSCESFVRYCLFRFLEKMVLPRVDVVTVGAQEYVAELKRVGVREDKIEVVSFYVEDEFFNQPLRFGTSETFSLCYSGSFHRYHNLVPLIEAFELLDKNGKKVELLLIGDGVQRPDIEREVRNRKLMDKIRFAGRVPHLSLPRLLSNVDAFVLLMWKSGISTSLLEAAAAGKAIITLRRKEDTTLDRYFRHKEQIFMVNTLSPIEIAEAMELLLRFTA